jgi:hypothetical protein
MFPAISSLWVTFYAFFLLYLPSGSLYKCPFDEIHRIISMLLTGCLLQDAICNKIGFKEEDTSEIFWEKYNLGHRMVSLDYNILIGKLFILHSYDSKHLFCGAQKSFEKTLCL